MRPPLSRAYLPSMVPNFIGRQSEVEEIIGHVTSESTRLVSIWGSPGFGKTSVAIAVGHALQTQGLPVYWVSLRGLQSRAGLTSKILGLLRQPTINNQPSDERLSHDDEICQLFNKISEQSVFILDNADDLLESGWPKVKKEVMQLLEEILRQNPRVTCIVTTRESPSSETQGQSVGSGEKARRKFSSKGGRAPGYRLSPDHFQKFKPMPAPDWAQKMLCIIVPNR